jgi:glycosyltransferase involved in cell wall biosynthesis
LFLKNIPGPLLRRHAGALLYGQFYFGLLSRRPGAVLAGYADVLRERRTLRAARHEQRVARSCPDSEIERWIVPRMAAPGLIEAARRRLALKPAFGKPGRRLLHLTVPPEAIPGTDATLQDASLLCRGLGAEILHVFPGRRPSRRIPPLFFGWTVWKTLRAADRAGAVHLVFHPLACAFPYLRRLRGRLIYTVTTEVPARGQPSDWLRRRATFVVTHPRAAQAARAWRKARVVEIRPGVSLSHIRTAPPPPSGSPVLLMASAPWTRGQFRTKGIHLLLDTLRRNPDLRLILLWRGWHVALLHRLVTRAGVADRVEIIDRRVDLNDLFPRVHAVILLARSARLVKAWPHSLLEGLAAGRPVIVSEAVPMADYVRARKAGEVLSAWTPDALSTAVRRLGECAGRPDVRSDFAPERMIEAYRHLLDEPEPPADAGFSLAPCQRSS